MEESNLRKTHPQKFWLKMICRFIYYLGMGDCWYEVRSSRWQKYYFIWATISNSYMFIIFIDELLSHLRDDLTVKEKNDMFQFTLAQPLIWAKILVLYFHRDKIRAVLEKLLEENRSICPSLDMDKKAVKRALAYCVATCSVVYPTLVMTVTDAVITHVREGIPIRTEVTYYPPKHYTGFFVNILRFLIEFHWWYMITAMVLIDCLCMCSLAFTGFKFRRVRLYFESLRGRFLKNPRRKLKPAEEKQFWEDFVVGIKLHEDALWCARNVQHALGSLYSIQIVESIGLMVICLIKLVSVERNLSLVVANLAYLWGLIVVTGSYMTDGAEITYEASLISTAIFHCGWEFVSCRAGQRTLVVLALQRSQVPVYMTAFGIIILSYSNFITVLRSAYSFFAVMF